MNLLNTKDFAPGKEVKNVATQTTVVIPDDTSTAIKKIECCLQGLKKPQELSGNQLRKAIIMTESKLQKAMVLKATVEELTNRIKRVVEDLTWSNLSYNEYLDNPFTFDT